MFGMGFMEIFLIAIVAIIALGPEKLPSAMVDVAKFLKKFKSGVADAKSTLDTELNITEMKEEANKFKAQLEDTKASLSIDTKVDLDLDGIMNDDLTPSKKEKDEEKEVSTQEVKKVVKKKKKEKTPEATQNANKFKVNFDEKKEDNA